MINTISILVTQPPFELVITIGGAPSSQGVLQDLFCHPITTLADFIALRVGLDALVADPSVLTDDEKVYLDLDGDGTFTVEDRDDWLEYFAEIGLPALSRQNWPGDDPIGAISGRSHVIIIDPLSANAVKVTRATNDCKLADGVTDASPILLWTGDDYNHKVWFDLHSLDELNWDSVAASVRRFPTTNVPVTIYVRGPQTLVKEIGLFKNTAGWANLTKIVIRRYPTDRPEISCGSSEIEAGEPGAGPNTGKYRFLHFFGIFRASMWQGLKVVGHRGSAGARVFAHRVFRGSFTARYRKMEVLDWRGIAPSSPDAAAYPEFIDSQFDNRVNWAGVGVNPGTGALAGGGTDAVPVGTGIAFEVGSSGSLVERCHVRHAPVNSPSWAQPTFVGDAIYARANVTIRRSVLDGAVPHQQIFIKREGVGSLVEYNDISNAEHTGVGNLASDVTVQYNRIHFYARRVNGQMLGNGVQTNPDFGQSISGVKIIGNVIWNDGVEAPGWGIDAASHWIDQGDNTLGVIEENILFGAGLQLGHHGGWSGSVHKVRDWSVRRNVLVDLPAYNKTETVYNAPLVLNLGENAAANNLWGNVVEDNLIARLDGQAAMVLVRTGILTADTYAATDPIAANFTGNFSADPLFVDPENGDFRLKAGSPVTWLDAETPLTAGHLDDPDRLALVCEKPASSGIVTARGGFDGVVMSFAGFSGEVHVR